MPTRQLRIFVALFILGIVVWHAAPSAAADDSVPLPEVKHVRIGFNNVCKLGCWTQVTIELSPAPGGSWKPGTLGIQALDCDAVPADFVGTSTASRGEPSQITYIRVGRPDAPIDLLYYPRDPQLKDEAPITLRSLTSDEVPRTLPNTAELIVEFGASIGLSDLFRRSEQSDLQRTTVVTIDTPQMLPNSWCGYEGVDLVVIAGGLAVEKKLLDAQATDALHEWVRRGGTLLIECGEDAEEVVGPRGPLARFAPGDFVETIDRQPFGAIESYAGAEQPIDLGPAGKRSVRVPQWKNVKGRVELSERSKTTEVPLVVHWPIGFGQVIFVGVDLHKPPLDQWPERRKFLDKILQLRATSTKPTGAAGASASAPGRHLGYIDLSGQLRSALDQFEGVHLVPFWTVTLLTLAYMAILFPLNYIVAFRWLKRPQFAWVIFPVVALAFCVTAYAMANQAKGNRLRVNQIDLVDVDCAAAWARGNTWFNLFSPANAAYDLVVQPKLAGGQGMPANGGGVIGWFGLAGNGLGAMSSAAASLPLIDQPYTIEGAEIVQAPLAKWSSKSFVARWNSHATGVPNELTATLNRRLKGTITNDFPKPLTGCVLFYGRWAYPLGTIKPNETVRLDRKDPSTIETYLTHRHLFATRNEVPPYDRSDVDLTRILEVMMFHNAAGGVNYTGLLNRQQPYVDLSTQLEFGQAILVCHGGVPAAELQINGQSVAQADVSQHETIYRFVMPVTVKE